jgi:hypothetical protein
MGDFNAQIQKEKNGYQTVMGPDEEGNRSSEGKNLLDMCNRNDWVTCNNWFQKRRSHNILQLGWQFWDHK